MTSMNWHAIHPELWLLVMACVVLLADLFVEARQEHDLVDFLRRVLAEIPQERQIVQLMELGEAIREQWDQLLELAKKNSLGETPGTATESTEPVSTNSTAPRRVPSCRSNLGGPRRSCSGPRDRQLRAAVVRPL